VHTKPHLEIDTDDVKCSHGATVGRLDREQLFYLRSRGVPLARAQAILTLAFAKEMTDRVQDPRLADELRRAVLERQPERALLEEFL
jgi:Fe-S cluster assembly protein SufD